MLRSGVVGFLDYPLIDQTADAAAVRAFVMRRRIPPYRLAPAEVAAKKWLRPTWMLLTNEDLDCANLPSRMGSVRRRPPKRLEIRLHRKIVQKK